MDRLLGQGYLNVDAAPALAKCGFAMPHFVVRRNFQRATHPGKIHAERGRVAFTQAVFQGSAGGRGTHLEEKIRAAIGP